MSLFATIGGLPVVALVLLSAGCLDLGDEPVTVMRGQLNTGPGVVFAERGLLHEGTWEQATVFGEDGKFEIPLTTGGTWGFHAYIEGHIYLPIEVEIGEGLPTTVTQSVVAWEELCDRSGRCNWVEQSHDSTILTPEEDVNPVDNPVITNPRVQRAGAGIYQVTVDVHDPDGDLSNQILVHHIASGIGIQLNAPGPVIDGNYPNGTYSGTVLLPEDGPEDGPWQFVAADHECSNSDILEVLAE